MTDEAKVKKINYAEWASEVFTTMEEIDEDTWPEQEAAQMKVIANALKHAYQLGQASGIRQGREEALNPDKSDKEIVTEWIESSTERETKTWGEDIAGLLALCSRIRASERERAARIAENLTMPDETARNLCCNKDAVANGKLAYVDCDTVNGYEAAQYDIAKAIRGGKGGAA